MNGPLLWSSSAKRLLACGLSVMLLVALQGCVGYASDGYGYGYGGVADVDYGVDFFEPFGYDYGGWGGGYHVGPWRGGYGRGFGGGPTAYRPAGPSRSVPSIPTQPRSGGSGRGRR